MADAKAELVACGDNKRDWNLRVVETLKDDLRYLDHLSVHQYYVAGPGTEFSDDEYYQLMLGSPRESCEPYSAKWAAPFRSCSDYEG